MKENIKTSAKRAETTAVGFHQLGLCPASTRAAMDEPSSAHDCDVSEDFNGAAAAHALHASALCGRRSHRSPGNLPPLGGFLHYIRNAAQHKADPGAGLL